MKQEIVTVGLDLAKSVFQVHAIGGDGTVLVRRKLRRAEVIGFFTDLPSCLVGMEACASAHHWARELIKLGHDVRLMPPAYVKPYVKRGKTDAADAEAICEAVTRPTMRFVAVKTAEQQAVLMLHKSRDLMVRQRTMLINALRGHLAEYGIVTGVGAGGVTAMLKALHERQGELPVHARSALHSLAAQLRALANEVDRLEAQILAWHRTDETSRRLATIPGIGPITASAISDKASRGGRSIQELPPAHQPTHMYSLTRWYSGSTLSCSACHSSRSTVRAEAMMTWEAGSWAGEACRGRCQAAGTCGAHRLAGSTLG